jgi:hypothetical protein
VGALTSLAIQPSPGLERGTLKGGMDLFLGSQWVPLVPLDSVHLTPRLVTWAAARRGLSLGSPPWGHPWPSCRTVFGPPDRGGRAMLLPVGTQGLDT